MPRSLRKDIARVKRLLQGCTQRGGSRELLLELQLKRLYLEQELAPGKLRTATLAVRKLADHIAVTRKRIEELETYAVGQLGAELGLKATCACVVHIGPGRTALQEAALGPRPEGAEVCHRCDNPPCIKAEHLFYGTGQDNMRDKVLKGRGRTARVKSRDEYMEKRAAKLKSRLAHFERRLETARSQLAKLLLEAGAQA